MLSSNPAFEEWQLEFLWEADCPRSVIPPDWARTWTNMVQVDVWTLEASVRAALVARLSGALHEVGAFYDPEEMRTLLRHDGITFPVNITRHGPPRNHASRRGASSV